MLVATLVRAPHRFTLRSHGPPDLDEMQEPSVVADDALTFDPAALATRRPARFVAHARHREAGVYRPGPIATLLTAA